jgi:hypothetical protein
VAAFFLEAGGVVEQSGDFLRGELFDGKQVAHGRVARRGFRRGANVGSIAIGLNLISSENGGYLMC